MKGQKIDEPYYIVIYALLHNQTHLARIEPINHL